MNAKIQDIFKRHSRPLVPLATGQSAVLTPLDDVRAVLFDVYGTLLISASGDVGTANSAAKADAFHSALRAVGIQCQDGGVLGVECLLRAITTEHENARARGIEFPEIEITDVWRKTLADLAKQGMVTGGTSHVDLEKLAVEYEARVNPTWPMPNMRPCLSRLRAAGIPLGIVSNAQFFTLELFPALTGESLDELGFDADLQFFSYRFQTAKPGESMYRRAAEALARREIPAGEALFVGNDMLNDILPADKVGFRTALFAGDARSLRRREGDRRVDGLSPDVILTDLADLQRCLNLN